MGPSYTAQRLHPDCFLAAVALLSDWRKPLPSLGTTVSAESKAWPGDSLALPGALPPEFLALAGPFVLPSDWRKLPGLQVPPVSEDPLALAGPCLEAGFLSPSRSLEEASARPGAGVGAIVRAMRTCPSGRTHFVAAIRHIL